MRMHVCVVCIVSLLSCKGQKTKSAISDSLAGNQWYIVNTNASQSQQKEKKDTLPVKTIHLKQSPLISAVNTGVVKATELIQFAKTLIGVPYAWASIDPKIGFDCSGFITYVFTHFKIQVPRSSIDFTNVGLTIPFENAKSGDIILFTGTNPLETSIGHMGLVVSNDKEGIQFIHATSGKAIEKDLSALAGYSPEINNVNTKHHIK
jgi:cell wall-associated NlpC family hydrolase